MKQREGIRGYYTCSPGVLNCILPSGLIPVGCVPVIVVHYQSNTID